MDSFDLTLSLNGEQIPVTIQPHIEGDKTIYDVLFDTHTLSLYRDTPYTWTSDDKKGLNQADIQSIGDQIVL